MDFEELGRRAVACKGWRWLPGMANTKGGRILAATYEPDGGWFADIHIGDVVWTLCDLNHSPADIGVPDLDDPATLGCLLALVREVLGEVWLSPEWSGTERWWMVRRVSNHVACGPGGSTQAEALVLALEAADARLLHVEAMSAHQQRSDVHPYTCANRGDGRHEGEGKLVATFDGWVCPSCDYTQRYW